MCGIFSIVEANLKSTKQYSNHFKELNKRGPDASYLNKIKNVTIGFARLSIMELSEFGM